MRKDKVFPWPSLPKHFFSRAFFFCCLFYAPVVIIISDEGGDSYSKPLLFPHRTESRPWSLKVLGSCRAGRVFLQILSTVCKYISCPWVTVISEIICVSTFTALGFDVLPRQHIMCEDTACLGTLNMHWQVLYFLSLLHCYFYAMCDAEWHHLCISEGPSCTCELGMAACN